MNPDELRQKILALVEEYARVAHAPPTFVPGEVPVPVSGKVYGAEEMRSLVDASLDFWLTTGRFNTAFEKRLREYLGVKHAMTVNSGSSANLLAVGALTSPTLGADALRPGDEVITVAAGFPTTVNPILLFGMVPVFVDVSLTTYNAVAEQIEAAVTDRTRAIVLAHTLGNPFDLSVVAAVAKKHDLWLVEDCCDALGSTYQGRKVGTFGDVGTLSFYPAHHITMGEGGAVFTSNTKIKRAVESLRDWGRDCWCDPGKDNTCGKRFDWELGELPKGYDHKYTYSHLGFNLKITDMQAAVALAQMDRVDAFVAARRRNFAGLRERLKRHEDSFILPEATPGSDPSWFGFPMTIRPGSGIDRTRLQQHLDRHKIGSRLLFAGNLTRQPYFEGRTYRVAAPLTNSDRVTTDTLWLGVFPGITDAMLDYLADRVAAFVEESASSPRRLPTT